MNKEDFDRITEKSREKIAISQFSKEQISTPKPSISKLVASIILGVTLSAGAVYAGAITYNKIWEDPKRYSINNKLTEAEIAECISETEAEEIGNSYLKKIGFADEAIKSLGLEKEFFSNENVWRMSFLEASMTIDGKSGVLKSVQIPTWNYTIPYDYGIDRVEARKVAKELLEKYKPEDDKGEYKLIRLNGNMTEDKVSYIWYAEFHKQYGDLINKYERIFIGWVPTINGLYSLSIQRDIYEDNEERISKEEATRIAINKDKQIEKNKEIIDTKAEIRIEKVNENVYLREKNKEKYENHGFLGRLDGDTFYKTSGRVRKVWVVVIEYDKEYDAFTYYIDITTGEIIGGNMYSSLLQEEQTRNDPYNLIEK